ncbi:MAG: hypothetical protein R3Y65_03245 [Bacillota bacterium]
MKQKMKANYNPAERKDKLVEVSLFKNNKLPYSMILFSILSELIYTIVILGNIATNYMMGAITMFNIAVLFVLFTTAVRVNIYSIGWTKAATGFGIYMVVRALFVVPVILQPTGKLTSIYAMIIVTAVLLFVASVISYKRIADRTKLIKSKERVE